VPGGTADALRGLRQKVGLPDGLSEVGVERNKLPLLADLAVRDACHLENPRACTRDDLLRLYEASL
jgi:alcohol dehydrogenase